jgi:6-phosphogluconolactonase
MACAAWLGRVAIPDRQIHPIPAELGPEAAAESYTNDLAGIGEFDLVLLGLGEDGHTASLFPGGAWGSAAALPPVIPVHDAPKPPPQRVSLSPERLSRARNVLYMVGGENKREAVENWRAGADLPASRVCPADGVDVFLNIQSATSACSTK